jgi:ATP-binding cassette subfamily F protein 3
MPHIQIENVSKAYGAHDVLKDISWAVDQGDRIGLVGRNGCGKTTLLHILTGEIRADAGSVHRAKGHRIGYLPQDPEFEPGSTVLSTVLEGFGDLLNLRQRLGDLETRMAEGDHEASTLEAYSKAHAQYEHLDGYTLEARAGAVLDGLGFPVSEHDTPVDVLSGGQKNRLALGRLLASSPDVLLLDEPTNHLDLRAIEWFERFLADYEGTYVVISHDRYFLDRAVRQIIEIEHTRIRRYSGNYSFYVSEKDLQIGQQKNAYDAQQAKIARTEDYIQRNIAGQKTKQAKSRRKALEKIDRIDRPGSQKAVGLQIGIGKRGGDRVLQAEDIAKSYGDLTLFEDLSLIAWRGDRIGVVGPNGAGKSTLIKMLTGAIEPDAGWVRTGHDVEAGYYDQSRTDLDPNKTVLEEVWSVTPGSTVTEIRTYLGAFLFSGDEVEAQIQHLSGGEQSRVALAKLVRRPLNLLILDEPTNHLDIPSRQALEAALKQFQGTVIAVSHDRYFLNAMINRLLVIDHGSYRLVDGNYDSAEHLWDLAEAPAKKIVSRAKPATRNRNRDSQKDRRRIETIEGEIADLEKQISQLDKELLRPDFATDWGRLQELTVEKTALQGKVEARIAEWDDLETSISDVEAD